MTLVRWPGMGESAGGPAEGVCESAPSAAPSAVPPVAPSASRSAVPPVAPSASPSAVPPLTANVGGMCRNDFKLSEGVVSASASIAGFAFPPEVRDLFVKASLENMFTGIEANAAKV